MVLLCQEGVLKGHMCREARGGGCESTSVSSKSGLPHHELTALEARVRNGSIKFLTTGQEAPSGFLIQACVLLVPLALGLGTQTQHVPQVCAELSLGLGRSPLRGLHLCPQRAGVPRAPTPLCLCLSMPQESDGWKGQSQGAGPFLQASGRGEQTMELWSLGRAAGYAGPAGAGCGLGKPELGCDVYIGAA